MIDRSSQAPLIGLPARMDPGKEVQYLSRQYGDAVVAAGGVPIILPLVEKPEALRPLVESMDGLVLTGSSSDVDPASYFAVPEAVCGPVQPLRDKTDFMLLQVASQRRIPVLAICFGLQSLNVFMGGSLIQDIPTHLQMSIRHSSTQPDGAPVHPVEIAAGSLLEELAGGTTAEVNSTHHQAINAIGNGLEVIARAPDGVVEAVVGKDRDHWILGIQWHPEKSFVSDGFSKRIFEHFITTCCVNRRDTNERTRSKATQGTRRRS